MRNGHFYSRVTLLQDTDAARAAPAPIYEGVSAHPGLAVYALLLLANRDREEVVLYILCCNRAYAATELMLQQSMQQLQQSYRDREEVVLYTLVLILLDVSS